METQKNTPADGKNGFTLVETLVSLAVFSIVIVMVVGSLVALLGSNRNVQGEQAVMSNLMFALDSMTREIRSGYHYICWSQTDFSQQETYGSRIPPLIWNDCSAGKPADDRYHGLSFKENSVGVSTGITSGGATRIAYYFDSTNNTIYRRVGSGPAESIIASNIEVTNADFFVTGSEPLSNDGSAGGDTNQPSVTIIIEAREKAVPNAKPFTIQTTVTQRTLDL